MLEGLQKQKIRSVFINIVKNMDEKGQKITATMIGNGDLYEECKSYMENLQISATIAYEDFRRTHIHI